MSVDRKDIGDVKGPRGVTFKPSFQLNGDLTFQPLSNTRAFFNGDLALKASELNPVVDAIHAHGLTFQAMHQHFSTWTRWSGLSTSAAKDIRPRSPAPCAASST